MIMVYQMNYASSLEKFFFQWKLLWFLPRMIASVGLTHQMSEKIFKVDEIILFASEGWLQAFKNIFR